MSARNGGLEAAELLRAVISNAPIVLFALDAEGVFTLTEGRGLEVLGRKPGESVGQSVFDLYRDHPQLLENCRRALKGEAFTARVPVGPLTFETRYTPQLDWGGKVTGVIGVATDVSEAHAAAAAKDEFLSVISHELRTPLSSASGWAWMLHEGELNEAESQKAVATMLRNLDDIKRLIGELRDASQAATGQLRLAVKPTDLGAAVREAAKSLGPAAEAKDLALTVSAPSLRSPADKARIRQLAWILISNAVKYSPRGREIAVSLERQESDAVLRVADKGPGLPGSMKGQVFDLGRTPAADLPPRGRGLGLGLSIARRLAELHGGGIEFADAPGSGCIFTVRLPLGPENRKKRKP